MRPKLLGVDAAPPLDPELEEVRRLIALADPPRPVAADAEVELVGLEGVVFGLEGGIAVPDCGFALRGWLIDPQGIVESVWCDCDGDLQKVEFASRDYRREVLDYTGLIHTRPGYRAGFTVLAPSRQVTRFGAVIILHVVIRNDLGRAVLSAGRSLAAEPFVAPHRLFHEFHSRALSPQAMRSAAGPLLRGVIPRTNAWHDARMLVIPGPGGRAGVTAILALDQNLELLPHILAMLEMSQASRPLELLLVPLRPDLENTALSAIRKYRNANCFSSIKLLSPTTRVTLGSAFNEGIKRATGEVVALMRDDVLPPAADWLAEIHAALAASPGSIVAPDVWTFDRRPHSLTQCARLDAEEFEQSHDEILGEVAVATADLAAASGNVLVATAATLRALEPFDEAFTLPDWAVLDFLVRNRSHAPNLVARSPSGFQHLQIKEFSAGEPMERLWNTYAICRTLDAAHAAPLQIISMRAAN